MSKSSFLGTVGTRGLAVLFLVTSTVATSQASAQFVGSTFDFQVVAGIDGVTDGMLALTDSVDIVPETEVTFGADPAVPFGTFANPLGVDGGSIVLGGAFGAVPGEEDLFAVALTVFSVDNNTPPFLDNFVDAGQEIEPGVPFEGLVLSFGSADNPIDPLFGTTGFDSFEVESSTLTVFLNFGGTGTVALTPGIVDDGFFFEPVVIADGFDIATFDLGPALDIDPADGSGGPAGFQIDATVRLISAVPEPSSSCLLLLGVTGAMLRRRRR